MMMVAEEVYSGLYWGVQTSLSFSCVCCRVRSSPLKQSPGYQVELVIQLVWVSGEPPQPITSLAINSSYGL